MNLYINQSYLEDVNYIAELDLPWDKLENRSILLSGARGLIGSLFVDGIMARNEKYGLNCTIYALGRNTEQLEERFSAYCGNKNLVFKAYDSGKPMDDSLTGNVDYVVHLASNTHPVQYSTDPIGTITTNIIGTKNMLDYGVGHGMKRFVFASSNEIYGENRGDVEFFDEGYCGYIDSNTLRAGYPESKRCGETLCQAYKSQKGIEVVIPRLTRTYGPTMQMSDTKAISQFIKKGMAGEDIVLKSEGKQYYSYAYGVDSVVGLLAVMLLGENGEAYNIADEKSDIMLKDLAKTIGDYCGTQVVFEIPDEVEKAGYSTATKARLDGSKLKVLGWSPKYDIYSGIKRTLDILKDIGE